MRIAVRAVDALKYGSVLAYALLAAACSPSTPEASKSDAAASADAPPVAYASSEPVHVLITVPPGETPPADYGERMAALRNAPGVSNILVLKAEPAKDPTSFESLAIVDFRDEASLTDWMAGDGANAGSLQIRRADVLVRDIGAVAADIATTSFYAVNHYEPLVAPAEYKTYSEKYIVPNMAHQRSIGALVAYTMYLERAAEGVKPKSVLVKQYPTAEEHARAEAAKAAHKRDVLMQQPEWKQINDTRDSFRVDLTHTLSRPIS